MKRDIQGKFALKNDDYRKVRSLRLTDITWTALGVAAECIGMTRADYLEQMFRNDSLPSITRQRTDNYPCITRNKEYSHSDNAGVIERAAIALPQVADLETLRERILVDLKLGKQAPGYKTAHKALRRFIAELSSLE